jgi:hypothetical protein
MNKLMDLTLSLLGAIHKGDAIAKVMSVTLLSLMISPVTYAIDKLHKWQVDNEDYFIFVVGAIVIDLFLGILYHAFWLRDFSFKAMATGFITKMVIIVSAGYLFEGLNTLMVEQSVFRDYTIMIMRLMIFLYPAGSAFGNMYEMTGQKFPPVGFMNKLKQFSENTTINNERARTEKNHR